MGERSFLLHASHEHRDGRPNTLIDEDHESLFLVAKKNAETAADRSYVKDLHFDNGLTHWAGLTFCLHAKIRIAVRIAGDPNNSFRVCLSHWMYQRLDIGIMVQSG
jgi:hypothetical protein